jgi:hypothetical protein
MAVQAVLALSRKPPQLQAQDSTEASNPMGSVPQGNALERPSVPDTSGTISEQSLQVSSRYQIEATSQAYRCNLRT